MIFSPVKHPFRGYPHLWKPPYGCNQPSASSPASLPGGRAYGSGSPQILAGFMAEDRRNKSTRWGTNHQDPSSRCMYKWYPLVNQHSYGTSPFFMGKSTNSMVIFNSYVSSSEGSHPAETSGRLQRPRWHEMIDCSKCWFTEPWFGRDIQFLFANLRKRDGELKWIAVPLIGDPL